MTGISEVYPWFKKYDLQFSAFFSGRFPSSLPQSLLWTAPLGLGLEEFAKEKAHQWVSNTADLLWISPEPGSVVIKIEQIRAVIDFMLLKTFSGVYRLVVIESADQMNLNAQNALLKTLEEPPENAFIWLLTAHPKKLLRTIVSRCHRWSFFAELSEAEAYFGQKFPTEDPKRLWEASHFGPLNFSIENQQIQQPLIRSLKEEFSPLALAEHSLQKDKGFELLFDFFYAWILDWYRFHLGGEARSFPGEEGGFHAVSFSLARHQKLKRFFKKMIQLKKAKVEGISLNAELLLEDVLIEWKNILRGE